MQYLSQRLAQKSARGRAESPPPGPLAATQRERILTAAERAVAEKGCAGATVEGIVKLAGVSTVTFYEHFADKEACIAAAFDRAVALTRGMLLEQAPDGLPWPEQVRAGVRALLAAIEAEPARARLCLVEAQMGGPALVSRYEGVIDGAVAKLREGRDLTPAWLPDSLEQATVGGLAWLLRQRLELGDDGGVGDLYPRMLEIALNPYLDGGEEQALPAAPLSADG